MLTTVGSELCKVALKHELRVGTKVWRVALRGCLGLYGPVWASPSGCEDIRALENSRSDSLIPFDVSVCVRPCQKSHLRCTE